MLSPAEPACRAMPTLRTRCARGIEYGTTTRILSISHRPYASEGRADDADAAGAGAVNGHEPAVGSLCNHPLSQLAGAMPTLRTPPEGKRTDSRNVDGSQSNRESLLCVHRAATRSSHTLHAKVSNVLSHWGRKSTPSACRTQHSRRTRPRHCRPRWTRRPHPVSPNGGNQAAIATTS